MIKTFLQTNNESDIENLCEGTHINVKYDDLYRSLLNNGYEKLLINKPEQIISAGNKALRELSKTNYTFITLEDMKYNYYLRELDSRHVGRLISTTAMVRSVSEIIPRYIETKFECKGCLRQYRVYQDNPTIISVPPSCQECGSNNFNLLPEESYAINTQLLVLQEPLELRKDGSTRDFPAYIEGSLVNPEKRITPGDNIHLTGLFGIKREKSEKKGPKKQFFQLTLNNVKSLNRTYGEIKVSAEDIEQINKLAEEKNIINRLKDSLAPHISGLEHVKTGILLQLFGGRGPNHKMNTRFDIHVLMVGDPGIAKSELLKSITKLSTKGLYVNGASATEAGILGAAVKDELTGRWTIEAGAMPLADQGLLCLDELDKMNDQTILSLNESMEQQTVTETKAGLNVTMSARTSVLAAANPHGGKLSHGNELRNQVRIPETTLSRFDLVYILPDIIDRKKDLELVKNILKHDKNKKHLDKPLINQYVSYAKSELSPELTEEAKDLIGNFFADLRQEAEKEDLKSITVRDALATIRLAIAVARIRLKDNIEVKDAQIAIEVYNNSLDTWISESRSMMDTFDLS